MRIARKALKPALTQDALSGRLAKTGITIDRAGIAKMEAGVRFVSDFELKALSEVLAVSPIWLLGMSNSESA